jgi:putative transposase
MIVAHPLRWVFRSWTCTACDTVHDWDVNAAKNILAAGRAA